MATVQSLCVYCGSSSRVAESYRQAARQLGELLARQGIELVYGGGRIGLMGICADAALAAGGRVTGIIPRHLHDVEVGHHGLTRLLVTESMHERKRLMFEMSDAFLVLPGGLGTLDEAFEIITWRQLALHDKPIIVVDIEGYWQPFQALVQHVVDEGFARPTVLSLFKVVPSIEAAFTALELAREPAVTPAPGLV
ncbi:MAG: TIGR00730 family Rossman fold protein [Rhodospirillales bacterium]|nr:TIGR00730 family Rossman fold protein [Rhodospirillales bacterium]